jgi:hypothetical protein
MPGFFGDGADCEATDFYGRNLLSHFVLSPRHQMPLTGFEPVTTKFLA